MRRGRSLDKAFEQVHGRIQILAEAKGVCALPDQVKPETLMSSQCLGFVVYEVPRQKLDRQVRVQGLVGGPACRALEEKDSLGPAARASVAGPDSIQIDLDAIHSIEPEVTATDFQFREESSAVLE